MNKAIKEFVITHFGNEAWEETFNELQLSENQFLSMEHNPDDVTFRIMDHVCRKLDFTASAFSEQIGEYFLSFSAKEGFSDLFELAGDTLPDLLQNLNDLHFRVKMLMPNLNPPRFEVSEQTPNSLKLHYYSSRAGFTPFLMGTLKGLTKKFALDASMTLLPPVNPDEKCIVLISWK